MLGRALEVPDLPIQEAVILQVNPGLFIVRYIHVVGSLLPLFDLGHLEPHAVHELLEVPRMLGLQRPHGFNGIPKILACHQICVGVIVYHGIVLVRTSVNKLNIDSQFLKALNLTIWINQNILV